MARIKTESNTNKALFTAKNNTVHNLSKTHYKKSVSTHSIHQFTLEGIYTVHTRRHIARDFNSVN